MSSYYRLIFFFLLLFTGININANKINKTTVMLMAIDQENKHQFKEAQKLYFLLLKDDTKYEYLQKILDLCIITKDYDTLLTLTAKYKHIFKEYEEALSQLEIKGLLQVKQYKLALNFSYILLKKFNNSKNYEIVGRILYTTKNYKESLKYFESAYVTNKSVEVLLFLADILYTYMDEKNKAISYLETFLGLNGCQPKICDRLLLYYQEIQNYDGMVSILKKVYKKYKDITSNKKSLNQIVSTIVDILKIKNINNAIKFLEENKIYDIRLLTLYNQTKDYKKALTLTRKLYKKTKDVKFLAQLAISEYEMAINKADVLETVIANFTIALKKINNAIYYNYFGYILIDNNRDLKKGIMLIKKALEKDPSNYAYQDSLAWGYYKIKECKKAKNIMEMIKKNVGLEDKELSKHYNTIKECK